MSNFKIGSRVVFTGGGWHLPGTVVDVECSYEDGATYTVHIDGDDDPTVGISGNHLQMVEESDTIKSLPAPDMVDRPNHYTAGMPEGVEVIDIINAQGGGYLHGNVIKYILRWKFKNGLEDLKKARVYLNWLIEKVEAGDEG